MKNIKQFFKKHGLKLLSLATMAFLMLPMLCSMVMPITGVDITYTNPNNVTNDIVVTYGEFLGDSISIVPGDTTHLNFSEQNIVQCVDGQIDIGDGFYLPVTYGDGYYALMTVSYSFQAGDYGYITIDNPLGEYSIDLDGATIRYVIADEINLSLHAGPVYNIPGFNMFLILVPVDVYVPTPTESITNVWTALLGWLTSSLSSVQGLFYGDTLTPLTFPNLNNYLTYDGTDYVYYDWYAVVKDMNIYYDGHKINESNIVNSEVVVNGITYVGLNYDGTLVGFVKPNTGETYLLNNGLLASGSDAQLTLLGTLAVIGLSFGLAMLLIMVIKRFLSLRS